MKPDLHNKWMEAELGTFSEGSSPAPPTAVKASKMASYWDFVYASARIVITLLFALHGAQKLFGIFGGQPIQHDPWILGAGILEFIGGVALALGLYTRPVALVLCCEMAWAYYKLSSPGGLWPIPNHGEFAGLYCFFFLFLAMLGPGNISFDRQRGKS
jgi:putative oxidoreductase